jgi:uncharacterized membrane protein
MKNNKSLITTAIALILSVGAFSSQLFAQQTNASLVGKVGKLHIGSSVMVGKTLLEPGMYQVQRVIEGEDYLIIFRVIRMGYRDNMGNEQLGEEVARLKCRIEPLGQRWKHTKLHLERNSSNQRVVRAVQIAGEAVLHKFEG